MRRVPRSIPPAQAVVMADHRSGVGAVRGPLVAGEVPSRRQARGEGAAMRIRSG